MGWLRVSIGPAIVLLLAFNAGQAMALTTLMAASVADADNRPFRPLLIQNQLFDAPRDTSPGGLTQNQQRLLRDLLDLPGLTEREITLFRRTLQRNVRLSAAAEDQLRRYLRQRLAELLDQRRREEERRAAEAEQRRQEEERRRAAELERQRQEEEQRRAAELERQRQEEERQRAAELERQRQEEERRRAAELARQRQEEEQRRAAELARQRQEEEQRRAAELARQRQEEERRRAAELERQRQEEEARKAAELEELRREEEARQAAELERQRKEEEERQRIAAIEQEREQNVLTGPQRQLLEDLIGLRAMSSVEKGIMRKVLEDDRRLNPAEEARLRQRFAALQTIEDLKAPDEDDVAINDPPDPEPTPDEEPEPEPEKVDLIDLLPRSKIEMPSPI